MFSKHQTTQNTGYRKYVLAALGATAALVGGAALLQHEEQPAELPVADIVTLMGENRDFAVDTHNEVADLIDEFQQAQLQQQELIDQLQELSVNPVDMKNTVIPSLNAGASMLQKTITLAYNSIKTITYPDQVSQNFHNVAVYAAEVRTLFPKKFAAIVKERQHMKDLSFDMGSAIQDVSLMADSLKSDISRLVRKLNLRANIQKRGEGELKVKTDAKIWDYEVKSTIHILERQQEKLNAYLGALAKILKSSGSTATSINGTIDTTNQALMEKIADLKQLRAQATCDYSTIITDFGSSCRKKAQLRRQYNSQEDSLLGALNTAIKMKNSFTYFDDLMTTLDGLKTRTQTHQASITKTENALKAAQAQTHQKFSDDDYTALADQFGDNKYLDDATEKLLATFETIENNCDTIKKDALARKHALDKALIWGM